jgi:hypothetical protein
MYKVTICTDWNKLPESLKIEYEFMKDDYYNVLYIEHDEKIIFTASDCGEPEDNSFLRDYKWIKRQIEEAYIKGYSDGCGNYEG